MKKLFSLLISVLSFFALTSCTSQTEKNVPTLSNSEITMLCDSTGTISLSTRSQENIIWKTSDNSVIQATANPTDNRYCNLVAMESGTAIIEVIQGDNALRCMVRVVPLQLERIEGNQMTLDLKDGYASQNIAVFTNINDGKKLSYYSDNLLIAYVQNDGTVVATGVGTTTVTAVHPSGLKYTVQVIVNNSPQG